MKRHVLVVALALTLSAFAAPTLAQSGYARIAFTGNIVNEACDSSAPPLGTRGGMGSCGGADGAVYVEQTETTTGGTGVAMLDYFADRSAGTKYLVTREYR